MAIGEGGWRDQKADYGGCVICICCPLKNPPVPTNYMLFNLCVKEAQSSNESQEVFCPFLHECHSSGQNVKCFEMERFPRPLAQQVRKATAEVKLHSGFKNPCQFHLCQTGKMVSFAVAVYNPLHANLQACILIFWQICKLASNSP